jgi:hypothetical protein
LPVSIGHAESFTGGQSEVNDSAKLMPGSFFDKHAGGELVAHGFD